MSMGAKCSMALRKKFDLLTLPAHQHILLRCVIVMVALLQMAFPFLFFILC